MKTLLLSSDDWDLVVGLDNNIAVASDPYSQAQDAASAIRLFRGELYYNTVPGIPYWEQILGKSPPVSLMKAKFVAAALTVPGVKAARCFIASWVGRIVSGQVQITNGEGRQSAARLAPIARPSPPPPPPPGGPSLDFSIPDNSQYLPLMPGL